MRYLIPVALLALSACATVPASDDPGPLIVAHRGASGERPEHTLAAYERAIAQGTDYIEPDLVLTRDGVLVVRHENEISGTTDVADHPEFADRKTTKTIDGMPFEGWFTEDFTLAELKTLRARERLPQLRSTAYDGQFPIPTFAEVLALAAREGVGVYPETKHPAYFASIGLSHEAPLLAALHEAGWDRADAPVFVQSFEVDNLVALSRATDVRLIQLMAGEGGPPDRAGTTYAAMLTDEGLRAIAAYADGVGLEKAVVIPRDAEGRLTDPSDVVARAHAAGLEVHVWTMRRENYFLPLEFRSGADPRAHGDLAGEIAAFLATGVDGLFSDNVAEAVAARR